MPTLDLSSFTIQRDSDHNFHTKSLIHDIYTLILLNEFLRKELIISASEYVKEYNHQIIGTEFERFDFTVPVGHICFNEWHKKRMYLN